MRKKQRKKIFCRIGERNFAELPKE